MVKILKSSKKNNHSVGDILYGVDYVDSISIPTKIDWKNKPILFLDGISPNTWEALTILNIDFAEFKSKVSYQDPYSNNTYYWQFPIGIQTSDLIKYAQCKRNGSHVLSSIYPWLFDADYIGNMYKNLEIGKISKTLLGHGYTSYTLPDDGSNSLDFGTINLDNGDQLICAIWIWYNK